MASKTTSIKSAAKVLEDIETVEQAFLSDLLEAIDGGIKHVSSTHNVSIQKDRYKAMRAIAFQAFSEYFEAGDWDALVERATTNATNLPAGWTLTAEMAKASKPAPAPKPVAKQAAPKPAAKATKAPAKKAPAKPAPAVEAEVVHEVASTGVNACTCGESFTTKALRTRHINAALKSAAAKAV